MMQRFSKLTLVFILSAASLTSGVSFADKANPPGPSPDTTSIIAAINNLGKKIEALSAANVKANNNAAYQANPNLPNVTTVNTQNNNVSQQSQQKTVDFTESNIRDSLQQTPDITLTYNGITPDVQQVLDRLKKRSTHIDDLTLNLPASDTLYSAVLGLDASSYFSNGNTLSKPTTLHDDYFDFSSVINPKAYTADQQNAVQNYVELITQRYKPMTDNINFNILKSNLDQLKSKPDQLAQTLYNFMNNPVYKNYQLTVRAALANQSIALNNFAQFIAERSPMTSAKEDSTLDSLSQAVGVKPYTMKIDDPKNPGQKITVYAYASPMQVQEYIAKHRVNNSQWYQQMNSASPAAVSRETLFVLAEMEAQMYQAHLDNERLIATLTALQLQSSSSNQMMLQTQANDLNQVIKATGPSTSPTDQSNQNPQNFNPNNSSGSNGPNMPQH